MSDFRKYDHVERFGHPDVADIAFGDVHVFPKLDGTNGSVWVEDGEVRCASRNRVLSASADNHGFHAYVSETFAPTLRHLPSTWILYGEWLVPHTLRTYREEAWRRFWVFDVFDRELGRYVPFANYKDAVDDAVMDFVEPLAVVSNGTEEQFRRLVDQNTYLIQDGKGAGEGIVLKNYRWINRHGRQPWAKLVCNDFKEANRRLFGVPEIKGQQQVEMEIAECCVTKALVDKERSKILAAIADGGSYTDQCMWSERPSEFQEANRKQLIPRLLQQVYQCVVQEELWVELKRRKDPTIDFKKLRQCCILKTKQQAPELF